MILSIYIFFNSTLSAPSIPNTETGRRKKIEKKPFHTSKDFNRHC